jgi:uncharacterized OsmC-like protein
MGSSRRVTRAPGRESFYDSNLKGGTNAWKEPTDRPTSPWIERTMSEPVHQDRIRAVLERNVKAVSLRPAIARSTARTQVRLKPGLECELEEGPWKMTIAMGEKSGGTGAGPGPGVLGRGALGSCLALGYAMWSARLGVPFDSLTVEVEADYDSRGELGISDEVPPGYTQVRYTVTVASRAPEADVRRVLDTADRYSPYRDVFARAHDVRREVRILSAHD